MMTRQETIDLAVKYFEEGHACSQSVLLAFADRIGLDKTIAKRISGTFGGGMGRLRSKCGALTGGFMVLGMVEGYEGPEQMEQKMEKDCSAFLYWRIPGYGCRSFYIVEWQDMSVLN